MTSVRVSLVDVYVLRGVERGCGAWSFAGPPGGRCPGSWETVHGHIEEGEHPADAAARELQEETGLAPERLYNLSRVEIFYQHRQDEVALVPVFVAFVASGDRGAARPGARRYEWLDAGGGGGAIRLAARAARPRGRVQLLGSGDGGAVEDVLRVC